MTGATFSQTDTGFVSLKVCALCTKEAEELSFLLLFLLTSLTITLHSHSQVGLLGAMNPGVSDSTTNPGEVFTSCLRFELTPPEFGRSWTPAGGLLSYQARLALLKPRPVIFDPSTTSADRLRSPGQSKRTFSEVDTTDTADAEQPIPKKACPDRSWHPLFKENPKAILLSNDDIHFCADRDILSSYRYVPLYLSPFLSDPHTGLTHSELQSY
jgi:hypothetical protein